MLRNSVFVLVALLLSVAHCAAHASAPAPQLLKSPDGRIAVSLSVGADGVPTYAVERDGHMVIAPSPLGVQLSDDDRIDRGLRIAAHRASETDTTYPLVAGKAAHARDRYRQLEVDFADAQGRTLGVVLRAYDDGIALRYRLPLPATGDLVVKEDLTGFLFPRDYRCWALNLGRFGTSHEGEYDPIDASKLRPHNLIDLPLPGETGDGATTFAIAEADLRDYAGLYLTGRGDGRLGVEEKLSPRLD